MAIIAEIRVNCRRNVNAARIAAAKKRKHKQPQDVWERSME